MLGGLAAIAGAAFIALVLLRPAGQAPRDTPQPQHVEPGPQSPAETALPPASSQWQQPAAVPNPGGEGPALPVAASANLITNWEDKVDAILAGEGTSAAKAKQLLEMFERLPPDGQAEVAKHLSNLMSDQDYAPLGRLLADPQLPREALDTLMADALNRPNSLKLPALLEVARTSQHPKAGDAKQMLELLLGADYGDDWSKWQEKVQEWLKDNPD